MSFMPRSLSFTRRVPELPLELLALVPELHSPGPELRARARELHAPVPELHAPAGPVRWRAQTPGERELHARLPDSSPWPLSFTVRTPSSPDAVLAVQI